MMGLAELSLMMMRMMAVKLMEGVAEEGAAEMMEVMVVAEIWSAGGVVWRQCCGMAAEVLPTGVVVGERGNLRVKV